MDQVIDMAENDFMYHALAQYVRVSQAIIYTTLKPTFILQSDSNARTAN